MLTALVRADGDGAALAATFSVLIPAVVAGSLGHAVALGPDGNRDCERVAELTGADYLAGGADWRAGAAAARGDWLLLLDAGELPDHDWLGAIERHLMVAYDRPALLPLAGFGGLRERLGLLAGPRLPRPGIVAPKPMILAGRLDRPPLRLSAGRRPAR